jgi:uncharacterized membrane protein HdeD (DUF308 family)
MQSENQGGGAQMNEAVRKTLIFSAVLILGGVCGCVAGASTGDTPPIVFGAAAIVSGTVLAILAVLARRKTRH